MKKILKLFKATSLHAAIALVASAKAITLNPVTSTGQTFTITQGWIWLSAWDSYGRQQATTIW